VVEPTWFFTRKQWIYAGVGTAFAVLLLAWLVTALLNSGSNKKLQSEQPLVARARETAPVLPGTSSAGDPAKTKILPAANLTPAGKPVPQELTFSNLKLQGIFYSAAHPTAILNGKMVQPQDRIAGALVVNIGPSSVTLEYLNQRKTLILK